MKLLTIVITLMFNNIFSTYTQVESPNIPYQSIRKSPEILIYEPLTLTFLEDVPKLENDTQVSLPIIKPTTHTEQYNLLNNNLITNIILDARQYLGQPYVWGGKTPKSGFDCSGLIGHVFKNAGYNIGSSTSQQFTAGKSVNLNDAKVGDIICTRGNGPTRRHVKLISKIENGQIYTIEAKGKKWGIVESPLKSKNNIVSVRRIINS